MNSLQQLNVHIGPGKTGTSSLQASLARNSKFLASQGYLYPTFWGPRGVVARENILSWGKELREALRKSSAHTLLISSEFLQEAHLEINDLAFSLGIPSERVRIIATVRDRESLYISHLHQFVKAHYDVSRVRPLRWSTFMPAWEERFDVVYVPYLDDGSSLNLVERLWQVMCSQLPPAQASWENKSPTAEESYLLQEFHRRNFWNQPRQFRPETKVYHKKLRTLESAPGPSAESKKANLSPRWAQAIQEFTRDDQRFLADRGVTSPINVEENDQGEPTERKPEKWVGPEGIEDVLEVDFELARAMRQELKTRLIGTAGLENIIL